MAFQACLETHCIGELGDDDEDNGDNKFLIYGSALGLTGKVGDQKVSVIFWEGSQKNGKHVRLLIIMMTRCAAMMMTS